jgi:NADPH:quinone reductase-like Zn-dependent oxidoreductase
MIPGEKVPQKKDALGRDEHFFRQDVQQGMKAIYFNQTGDPLSVLMVGEFDKPVPQPGEVCVKMIGSPLNPADFKFIEGTYRFKPAFPQIAGLEGAGFIESAGAGVTLPAGTLVSFFWRKTWAEYTVVPEEELIVLPAGFPVEKAALFALNPFTAWGLLERAGLRQDDWLLLTAGNSVVAQLIIQLAGARGIRVIATVRDKKYKASLKKLGAEVIDLSTEGLEQRVQEITGGRGLQGALDAVGGATATGLLKCMAADGRVIAYAALSPEPFQVNNSLLVYKNISLSGFGIRGYLNSKSRQQKAGITQQLAGLVAKEDFKLEVRARFPMDDIRSAVFQGQQGGDGKILLDL